MALGGGTFLVQNKVLPGSYINFISAARASATLSDRGYAAMALELDWGTDDEIFTVENGDFQTDSLKIFGYDYTSPKLKGIRDLFLNAKTLYAYRLNSGLKAENNFAKARCSGERGNNIKIIVEKNIDDSSKFNVITVIDDIQIDLQSVKDAAELTDNDFVVFKKDAVLSVTAGVPLTGGTNGSVTGNSYQQFLDKIESFSFNTLGCLSTDEAIKGLFIAFTKRMRDESGVKFQTVLYDKAADYEGIINLKNRVLDEGANEASLVYWLTGASAGCAVNRSNTNRKYDGEYTIFIDYKQSELEKSIKNGELLFHKVGDEIRVLTDISSFTSFTVDKNEDFSMNQVVRVLDQIGNDIATLFNDRYLGKVQNNNAGRVAFWNDIITYCKQMETIQALQDFLPNDVIVEQGTDKRAVAVTLPINPVAAMEKLYMTVIVE